MTGPTVDESLSKHATIAQQIIGGLVSATAPAVSPDGTHVAFAVARVDMTKNKNRTQIWLARTDGSVTPRPLTSGERNDTLPTWSPDGATLAFASSRSDVKNESTLNLLPMSGPGELRTVATMNDGVNNIRFSPDGCWIGFNSRTEDARYAAEDESWQPPRKIEHFFSRLNGEGWICDRPNHVYVVPVDGTTEPRNLTPGPFQHSGVAWTSDSAAIITNAARHPNWDLDFATDLYLVPLNGEITPLTSQTGAYYFPTVSPDGKRVAFIGTDDPSTDPQNAHVGILDLTSGGRHWASRGLDRTFDSAGGSRPPVWLDNERLLAGAEDRGTGQLYIVTADGSVAPQPITTGARWVKSWDAANGVIGFTSSTVDRPAELFCVALDSGEESRLSHLTDTYVSAVNPQTWERFAVPTTDGSLDIDAWIMKPAGFEEGAKYPVIVNVHGGPHTQYGETYFDEAQFQAAAGFVVVMSNPRGASGREESWGQAILGPQHPVAPGTGWGTVDVDDVLAVLDAALDRYEFCDRDRVGMQGGSYGGYMATMLAGRYSSRFKGICSERAVNNMLSEEWSSDIGSVFRVEHGPSYLDAPAEYERMSPVRYIRDITVPMLIVHSEDDLRCPISQAEELFMGLRLLGKDVAFYRFPGETHELSRSGSPVHRRQRAEIILDWFAEKLA